MSVAEFKKVIARDVQIVGYIRSWEIVNETPNAIKARLIVNNYCFIQIYVNVRKRLKNYVVILNGLRLYGRDCDGGKWHKHPWNNHDNHEFDEEIPLKDFLFEVYEGLMEKELI